ncbi:hypothetical protein L208DRAFT_1274453, partial [Tricholoma matsutake]
IHHWAIPCMIWKAREEERQMKGKQLKLDGTFERVMGPKEFTCDGVLDAVSWFVACNDQSLAMANKASFCNCLVSMRPKSITKDILSTHNVTTYIHNQFVKQLEELKGDILVS